MSVPLKWSVTDCASTLYACGFTLDEADKLHKKKKKDSKQKKYGDEIKQPVVGDKDYIVFKFKEDGEFDRVKEKSASNQNLWIEQMKHNHMCLKELIFSKNSEGLKHGLIISEGEEKSSTNSNNELLKCDGNADSNVMKVTTKVEGSAELKALSDSNRPDSSSGSFAFPEMNLEMESSPRRMPNKVDRSLHFGCCGRF